MGMRLDRARGWLAREIARWGFLLGFDELFRWGDLLFIGLANLIWLAKPDKAKAFTAR